MRFAVLRQLWQIGRWLPTHAFQTLVIISANASGRRQQRTDWSSGLPGPSSAVGAERGGAPDVTPPSIRPHHRRANLSQLVARTGAHRSAFRWK